MKFSLAREITINASEEAVKKLVLDFKHWNSWSPWNVLEPSSKVKISGKAGEVGHGMLWEGELIGSGKMNLKELTSDHVWYDLEFLKPFKSVATSGFEFKAKGKKTQLIWHMHGSMPIFLFFMIPMMKGWLGMDFDRGLRMIKALAEEGKINATTTYKGVSDFKGFSYIGIQRQATMSEVGPKMQADFDTLMDLVTKDKTSAKHWVALYPKMDVRTMTMTYIAAISDENLADTNLSEEFTRGSIASGQVLEIEHKGSYEFLGNAWSMGMMYLRAKKIKQKGVPFEYYWNNPKETKEDQLKTSVYFPLK